MAGDPPVRALDAYAVLDDFPFLGQQMQVGQFKIPFGYEVQEPSEVRLAPERSTMINSLFPNYSHYDRGVMASGMTLGTIQWSAGVFNGSGIQSGDDDQRKILVAMAKKGTGKTKVGAAVHFGCVAHQNKNLLLLYGERPFPWFNVRSEAVIGKAFGYSAFGWYGQASRQLGPDKIAAGKLDYWKGGPGTTTWSLGGGLLRGSVGGCPALDLLAEGIALDLGSARFGFRSVGYRCPTRWLRRRGRSRSSRGGCYWLRGGRACGWLRGRYLLWGRLRGRVLGRRGHELEVLLGCVRTRARFLQSRHLSQVWADRFLDFHCDLLALLGRGKCVLRILDEDSPGNFRVPLPLD
jgi:hypothetical protein